MRPALWMISLLSVCSAAAVPLTDGLYAALDTSMGGITCRLDYAEAPVTCANFVSLTEGTHNWIDPITSSISSDRFYDGLTFHRVATNFVIQGGCPLGNGFSGPGYRFLDEFSTNLTHHSAGILSMANSGPDSNGSQFFITLRNTSGLDNKHSVFGEVVDGTNVLFAIGAVPTVGDTPLTEVLIHQINILRIGTDAQNFDPSAHPLPQVDGLQAAIDSAQEISTGPVSNQTDILLFDSTNLMDWEIIEIDYVPAGSALWSTPGTNSETTVYFKGAAIRYPQAVTAFTGVEGHTLTFSNAVNTVIFQPTAGGGGTANLDGTPDTIISWAEWTSDPFLGRIFFRTATLLNSNPLQFHLTPEGTCTGFQWSGSIWVPIGEFTFTITP